MTKKSSSRSKKSRRGQAEIPYCYELFDPLQSHALLDLPREIQCMITCRFSLTNMKTWSVVLCRHCCLQSRPTVIESYLKSVCSSATTSLSFMKELSRLKVFDRLPYGVKAYLYHRSWKESMTIPAAPSRLQSIAFIKILNSRNSWTDVNVLTRALLWAVSNNFSEATAELVTPTTKAFGIHEFNWTIYDNCILRCILNAQNSHHKHYPTQLIMRRPHSPNSQLNLADLIFPLFPFTETLLRTVIIWLVAFGTVDVLNSFLRHQSKALTFASKNFFLFYLAIVNKPQNLNCLFNEARWIPPHIWKRAPKLKTGGIDVRAVLKDKSYMAELLAENPFDVEVEKRDQIFEYFIEHSKFLSH